MCVFSPSFRYVTACRHLLTSPAYDRADKDIRERVSKPAVGANRSKNTAGLWKAQNSRRRRREKQHTIFLPSACCAGHFEGGGKNHPKPQPEKCSHHLSAAEARRLTDLLNSPGRGGGGEKKESESSRTKPNRDSTSAATLCLRGECATSSWSCWETRPWESPVSSCVSSGTSSSSTRNPRSEVRGSEDGEATRSLPDSSQLTIASLSRQSAV